MTEYNDISFTNDFVFCTVLRENEDLCKELVELILDIKISRIANLDRHKEIDIEKDSKSVRMDVYIDGDENTVYDIEMQTSNTGNLPKRARYYQGMIDLNTIEPGDDYNLLKKTFVIFIDTFDLFGHGQFKYTFSNMCHEVSGLELGDETTKVFLNAKGTKGDITEEMRAFLRYIASGDVTDVFSAKLEEKVEAIRKSEKWSSGMMTFGMKLKEERREALKEGITQGRAEGRVEGRKELIKQMLRVFSEKELIASGVSSEEIEAAKNGAVM